jgi:SAM-dependent methyltransferase
VEHETGAAGAASDPYAVTAEFYDLAMKPHRERLAPQLSEALSDADPAAGPVLDLGAGTGLSTVIVAEALPEAAIVALEPSRAMRSVLLSRLLADGDLRRRVTALPFDLAAYLTKAGPPETLGGAVALGMMGHLEPSARAALWRMLGERLAPGAPAVIELQPPERPEEVPRTLHARTEVGELTYEGWSSASPTGPRSLRWTMTHRVLRAGTPLEEHTTEHPFLTISARDVAREAATAGLACEPHEEGLLVLRAP